MKVKVFKFIAIVLAIFSLFWMLAIKATLSQDLIFSYKFELVELANSLGIYTLKEAQSYFMLLAMFSFIGSITFLLLALRTFTHKHVVKRKKANTKNAERKRVLNAKAIFKIRKRKKNENKITLRKRFSHATHAMKNAMLERKKEKARKLLEEDNQKPVEAAPVQQKTKETEPQQAAHPVRTQTQSNNGIDDILNGLKK